MQCEAPDTHFFIEIRDFNLEFLALIGAARHRGAGPVFGLDSTITDALARLSGAQLEAIAEVPCLLAGLGAARRARGATRIAEPQPDEDPAWTEQARLFAAGLLTWVWQVARRDSLSAALCVGPGAQALAATASFRDIRGHASHALQHVEARFRGSARFWPDLVRAARDGRPEHLRLVRLTAIQLATLESGRRPARPQIDVARLAGRAGTR